jgi:hypothetical protein
MNDDSDLPRWRHGQTDAPVELARLMQLGSAEVGSSDEVAELARRLSAVLGPAAGLPGASNPPADPGGAGQGLEPPASGPRPSADVASGTVRVGSKLSVSASRWIGWALGGTGALAGLWWAFGDPAEAPRAPAPVIAARPVSAERTPEVPPLQPAAPAPPPPRPAPEASRDGSMPQPEPRAPERPRAPAHVRAPRPGGEAQLLDRAQAALARRPGEALRLTREHEARFPRGALVQEREVIAIEALERLGRAGAAKARAAAFERRFRGSVHHPRVLRTTDTSAPRGGGPATLPQ